MTDTPLPDPCIGTEIAARLRVSADWWTKNHGRLEREEGFPAPLPGFKRPLRWSGSQVEAWIRAPRQVRPPAIAQSTHAGDVAGDVTDNDEHRARRQRLAQRSAQLATHAAE